MCGRITLTTDKDDIQSRWGFIDPSGVLDLIKPRFNISPSQNSPTVIVNQDNRELKMMRWGLIPFWAKEASIVIRCWEVVLALLLFRVDSNYPRPCLTVECARRVPTSRSSGTSLIA